MKEVENEYYETTHREKDTSLRANEDEPLRSNEDEPLRAKEDA